MNKIFKMVRIKCTKCKKWKTADLEHFAKNTKKTNGLHSWCRKCEIEYAYNYLKEHNYPPIMEGTKTCTKCNNEYDVKNFNPNKNIKCGRSSWCKKCSYAKTKQYVYKPKDGINANIKYKEKHPEKWNKYINEYQAEFRKDPINNAKKNYTQMVRYAIVHKKFKQPNTCQDCGKKCKIYNLIKDTDFQNLQLVEEKTWQNIVPHMSFVCSKCNINYRESKKNK